MSTCKELRNQLFGHDLVCSHCHIEAFMFSPQILTSHPCVFPKWTRYPVLRNGFAEHSLQAMLQPSKSVCHEQFPQLTQEAVEPAPPVEQVDYFLQHFFFQGELLHSFSGNSLLFCRHDLQGGCFCAHALGECKLSQGEQVANAWVLQISFQHFIQTLQVFCSAVRSNSEVSLERFANRRQDPQNNLFTVSQKSL